ncbi:MAG: nucleotidyltransferase domain-containing protein [Nitrososphaerota archaeon]|nr:nucleotidyltransferase domain-containing protein [Nitrososphaerota archaeon]
MGLARRRAELARGWREVVPDLADEFHRTLPGSRVYAFGSAVRGDMSGGSDVDILVVSDAVPAGALARARLKVRAEEGVGLPDCHPFEFHLVTEGEAEPFLRRAGRDILLIEGRRGLRRARETRRIRIAANS